MIQQLTSEGYLQTPLVIEAFREVKRKDFVPDDLKNESDINAPLPIGFGQTISQPLTVAFMLEILRPQPGEKILDIGAGSGWQTAILAYIVSDNCSKSKIPGLDKRSGAGKNQKLKLKLGNKKNYCGKIYALELIPELADFGKKNIAKYNFIEKGIVEVVCKDGSRGLEEEAPFDKIIVAASATREPESLKKQLKIGGRLVVPIKESIWLFIKKDDKIFEEQEFPGFAFVPLIGG